MDLHAHDLTKAMQIHVRIRGMRLLRARLTVAYWLFRLAGRVAGIPTHVEVDL